MRRRAGLTLLETVLLAAAAGALAAALLPALSRCGAEARRARCAAHLRLALHGLRLYAEDHDGAFPTLGFEGDTRRFDIIGWRLHRAVRTAPSNSRNLFLAVRLGYVRPELLVCPETEDVPAELGAGGRRHHDFNVGHGDDYLNRLSYSYHLQFGRRDWATPGHPLTTDSDASMALLADRNPCLDYPGRGVGSGCMADREGLPTSVPAARANSRNHAGRGQNVAFVDGRVSWSAVPTVGPSGDNIYTVWSGADRAGGAIAPDSMPAGATDSFLVP